jgi:methylase of polypeptide subunit release factors
VSQRDSGYERKERDLYETPEWVTRALFPHLRSLSRVWEPACGSGKMVDALADHGGYRVYGTDIATGTDFLSCWANEDDSDAIITNPPYDSAPEFIAHALWLMRPTRVVAMLLRTDFDHAKTRSSLFAEHPAFAKKVVLTKRIRWFEDSKGSPSFNHAWFIWDWKHEGPPTLAYGP